MKRIVLMLTCAIMIYGCKSTDADGGESGFTLPFGITVADEYGSAEPCASGDDVCIVEPGGGNSDYIIHNNASRFYYAQVEIESDGMTSEFSFPLSNLEMPPGTSVVLATLSGETFDFYSYEYYGGPLNAVHDDDHLYNLPWPDGISYYIAQGYDSDVSHFGSSKYALDIDYAVGDDILAARAGKVLAVVENFTDACDGCEDNIITLLHSDGTLADYAHIEQNGGVAEVGDIVDADELIATSGNVGNSTGPHLHFEVLYTTEDGDGFQSVATTFDTSVGEIQLEEDETYSRP